MPVNLTTSFGTVYLTLDYDPAGPWVSLNWVGYQTFPRIQAGAEACLDWLRAHLCAYLLNDNRQVSGPGGHAVAWLVRDWAPLNYSGSKPLCLGLFLAQCLHFIKNFYCDTELGSVSK